MGIDVSEKRGLAVALMGRGGQPLDALWLRSGNPEDVRCLVESLLVRHALRPEEIIAGIDAPSRPLPAPRTWNWNGGTQRWLPLKAGCSGFGRHCEIIIKAHKLANPQWTPVLEQCPGWMLTGFALFEHLGSLFRTVEVFPSASYRQLHHAGFHLEIVLNCFSLGPKDMLDAFVAAATAREYIQGRGVLVGGGDGLGGIALPRPLDPLIPQVMQWPAG